jgi:hypothetical protein
LKLRDRSSRSALRWTTPWTNHVGDGVDRSGMQASPYRRRDKPS